MRQTNRLSFKSSKALSATLEIVYTPLKQFRKLFLPVAYTKEKESACELFYGESVPVPHYLQSLCEPFFLSD